MDRICSGMGLADLLLLSLCSGKRDTCDRGEGTRGRGDRAMAYQADTGGVAERRFTIRSLSISSPSDVRTASRSV